MASTKNPQAIKPPTAPHPYQRPTWQIELLEQQTQLQKQVGDMQTYANSTEFHRASGHIKEGVEKQLEATRKLLHVINERISYFL